MRVFVTGGTGLLGNTVIRHLRSEGHDVLALIRNEPDPEVFAGLGVQLLLCDLNASSDGAITDSLLGGVGERGEDAKYRENGVDSIEDAIASSDAVIHCAALIHLGWKQMEESMRVNRDGTRRLVDACLRYRKKLISVGTVNTIALGSPQTFADENTPLEHAGGQIECAYVKSKRSSLQVVREGVSEGLDAVIVHPGFMLGPWDWKPSSGRMMLEVGTGWKPVAPSGGCSLCDSRDVAAAVLSALKADLQSGREFILAGHNWTYLKLWTEMAKRMGTRPPLRAAGPGMEYLAGLAGDFLTRVTGKEPDFNSAGVAMSGQFHWYSSRRAQTELSYQIRDAGETLDAAGAWIRERFVLPRRTMAS
jgi:dihydroflavonol-4-reductase